MIPIIVRHYIQVPILLFVQTFYIEWYGYFHPHIEKKLFYIELINEILFLIVIYHMVYLTIIVQTWEMDGAMQYKVGDYLLYTVGVILGVNLVYAVYQSYLQSVS